MNKIIFHIGFPRTGSTYLQKKIFSKIKNINFLGKPFKNKANILFKEFEKDIFNYDEIFYKQKKIYLSKKIKKKFNKKVNVFSHEGLLRNTRFFEKTHKYYKGNNYSNSLRRIYEILKLITQKKNIYFMIFVRKQVDILPSYYSNFWESEYQINKKIDFEQFIGNCLDKKTFNFGKIIDYNQLFIFLSIFISKKNIIFLSYEKFFLKDQKTLEKFSSVLEIKKQEVDKLILQKKINSNKKNQFFYYKNLREFFPKFMKKRFTLNSKIKKKIFIFYRASNLKLDKKIKLLKLKSSGYY